MNLLSKKISLEKTSLWFALLFFILLTFFSSAVPFFWDGELLSREAHFYFENSFSGFILPHDLDRDGTPVLYAVYLAGVWKLFGKTLLMSHLALLPFLLGIAWEYFKLAKKFLHGNMIPFAMLLLILEPTLVTQSIIMGYDIALLYFFLLSLNALLSGNAIVYGLSLSLLGLCSIRGIILIVSLVMIHTAIRFVIEKKNMLREILWYAFPVLILAGTAFWHYHKTGWFFISTAPEYSHDRQMVPFSMMLRQSIYIIWYIVDFGRAFIWLFILGGFFYLLAVKNKIANDLTNRIIIISVFSVLIHILFLSPFSNPIAHRYFLNSILFSSIVLCYIFQEINFNKKIFYALASLICLGLITGNLWIYGGGFSNGWDSSLKTLPYFKLRNEINKYVVDTKINPAEVGTKFPIYQDIKYTDLASESFHYADINNNEIKKYKYILLSNISNQFTVQERKILNENWIPVRAVHAGQVFIKLLQNPESLSPAGNNK